MKFNYHKAAKRQRLNTMGRKTNASELEDDLRPEYDFSKMKIVGRGIYARRYRSGTNLVLLDHDVRQAFPDEESVNEALRVVTQAAKRLVLRKSSAKKRRRPAPKIPT